MNELNFYKLMYSVYQQAVQEAKGKFFVLKPDTAARLSAVRSAAQSRNIEYSEHFDPALNAIDIELSGYVFDSVVHDMDTMLLTPDFFVIDALEDGKIRIQARILNACQEIPDSKESN